VSDKSKSVLNLKTFDHIAMVVKDARKSAKEWESMLGIGPWAFQVRGGTTPDGQTVKVICAYAYMENEVEVEFIEIVEGRIFHSEFQETVGEGLHHVGYAVDDVLADTKKLVAQGAEVVMDQGAGCQYLRFEGDGGVITELYRKHPHFQDTMG
jgi:catechol 2,3-dioxygenase-like lactoylglutathione lyase family enzyme